MTDPREIQIRISNLDLFIDHNFVTTDIYLYNLLKIQKQNRISYIKQCIEGAHAKFHREFEKQTKSYSNAGAFYTSPGEIAEQAWEIIENHPSFIVLQIMGS